jgi:hypothetical protein
MAYARYGAESDVYVYATAKGWICENCSQFSDLVALQKHLVDHRSRGDKIPQHAIDVIEAELKGDMGRG